MIFDQISTKHSVLKTISLGRIRKQKYLRKELFMRKAVIAITLSMIFISFTVFAAAKQVSFIDQLKCIKCGTCIKTCPVKAISKVKIDGKDSYIVDPAKCISCGACNKACPTKAISWTADYEMSKWTHEELIIDCLAAAKGGTQ
jgi:formate hydrogenlyase subunit 6/NADH:ubiquinone oxidoreductase subunit I